MVMFQFVNSERLPGEVISTFPKPSGESEVSEVAIR